MSQRRVMVSGVGVVSSLGIGVEPVTAALRAGTTGIRRLPAMGEAHAGLPGFSSSGCRRIAH